MISTDTRANVTHGAWLAHRVGARDPKTLSARWAGVYLLVSGTVLGVTGAGRLVTIHLLLVAMLLTATLVRSAVSDFLLDFAPFVIAVGFAYGEVPSLVAALSRPYYDGRIQAFDLRLFGFQPAHALAAMLPSPGISELLHAGYLSYYLGIAIPPLILYLRNERVGFRQTTFALIVTWLIGCALFVAIPVQGPRYLWSSPPDIPDGMFRRLSLGILSTGSARGTAFPSLHMAASLSQTILAWRWQGALVKWAMTAMSLLVAIGAVYAGYHYATDMIAGAAVGLVTTAAVLRWLRQTFQTTPNHTDRA